MSQPPWLRIEGARQNNLKTVSVAIPHDRLTVITGISGSGKSSLAFDTLFAEGQWRYIESLSTYARMFLDRLDRPDVDRIEHIRPAIALEQKNPVRTARSTVGTATELHDYLRLLFARIGRVHCPTCGTEARSDSAEQVADALVRDHAGARALICFPLSRAARQGPRRAVPGPAAAWIRSREGGRRRDRTGRRRRPARHDAGGPPRSETRAWCSIASSSLLTRGAGSPTRSRPRSRRGRARPTWTWSAGA